MIKRLHTKLYQFKMRSNKVEYSISKGTYFMTHDTKVPLFILEFSSSKIISHCFKIDKNEGESGIGFATIIDRDMMVQLGI